MQIDILRQLNNNENNGNGLNCVKSIIYCLLKDDIDMAKLVYQNEGDKIRAYPKIQQWMYENFGCRTHLVIDCQNEFICKPLREFHRSRK